jgi:hypothetical protein
MCRDYRHGRGGHARDARRLADRTGAPAGALLDDLARQPGHAAVLEPVGNAAALERPLALEPFELATDVTIVSHF